MSFWSTVGKVAGFALDVIPGGGLLKTGAKLVAGALGNKPTVTVTAAQAAQIGGSMGALVPYSGGGVPAASTGGAGGLVSSLFTAGLPALASAAIPGVAGDLLGRGIGQLVSQPKQVQAPAIQPYMLDASQLRVYYRAPRGYVVIHDRATGQVYAILKAVARQAGLWRPAAKPPISVRDWHCYKRSKIVDKKLRKIAGPALRKHGSRAACATRKRGK